MYVRRETNVRLEHHLKRQGRKAMTPNRETTQEFFISNETNLSATEALDLFGEPLDENLVYSCADR